MRNHVTPKPSLTVLNAKKCGAYRKIRQFFARDRSSARLILSKQRAGMSFPGGFSGTLVNIAAKRTAR
ncbi:hypothetical protein E2R62_17925 [Citrobacter rodentium]|uniref:Uncharacterized protein n=1 Tax=Citrobacter rodentium TaxID=67825 RepID=A0A482PMI1_CITRO|nr:hypothetical protein E2R62_17925 [Citrobacter rodentium]HAT8013078.1 hypothetical protein [Citrobacter rodentium NBRC 105723 = DSM 16636]HAT8018220.1 hypothetical protein [Citrobacter rodentium]HAT8027685.1 hypothetical protein [Citrobacter rodentium]HAT8032950.1 hypothetical protein [Citrobacter rodentium]